MAITAVFAGLVVDENDNAVNVRYLGNQAYYVIDDAGFERHVLAEQIDRQVLAVMREQVMEHREAVVAGALQMLGQEDLFTKAMIEASLNKIDENFEQLLQVGLPEEARAGLGMMGFRVVVDVRGELLDVENPGFTSYDEG